MKKFIDKINETVAVKATLVMSTMWCVYAFTAWSMIPTFFPKTQEFVFYVSGGIVQLVALPLIMVGNDVLSRRSEVRAQQDHEALMSEVEMLKKLLENDRKERRILNKLSAAQQQILEHITQEKLEELAERQQGILQAVEEIKTPEA